MNELLSNQVFISAGFRKEGCDLISDLGGEITDADRQKVEKTGIFDFPSQSDAEVFLNFFNNLFN